MNNTTNSESTAKNKHEVLRTAVRREHADNYILISLVAFVATVIVTRVFLELTGYPQIGNSVLHIAHALWGGLLLIVAVYFPLVYSNRWAVRVSALLSGIGIGLFIDEIGKFITQSNDYFFPPALSLIYGFVLLNILVYLLFRRTHNENDRFAMYHVLDGLQEFLDGDVDEAKIAQVKGQLVVARQSKRAEIKSLADTLSSFLDREMGQLPPAKVGLWKRSILWINEICQRFGRRVHRAIISIALTGWVILVGGYIAVILQGEHNLNTEVLQWRVPLIVIQVVVGVLMFFAMVFWLRKREEIGLKFGVGGFLISLVALQLLYFYISQFAAITATLFQLGLLQLLFTYRRWYLNVKT